MHDKLFLCDKDLATILRVSQSTITRLARRKSRQKNSLSSLKPILVSGARRWRLSDVANAIGVSSDQIIETLK